MQDSKHWVVKNGEHEIRNQAVGYPAAAAVIQ